MTRFDEKSVILWANNNTQISILGQRFALLELKAALFGILRNFKLVPVDKPEDMKYKTDLVLRPAGEIRVKFVPRLINI